MSFRILVILFAALATSLALAFVPATAATVGADGGVTIWVSYDDSDAGPIDIDGTVTVLDTTSGASCGASNGARSANGAPDSPNQCPGGAASCTGREKVTGDIQRFAEYVWQSTEGATYIRRVYVADEGRSWDTADVQWNMNTAGSTGASGGWDNVGSVIRLRSSMRSCIHDVLHHEFGHYFHSLPDRYARSGGYYTGTINGGAEFDVDVTTGDPTTVMSSNFPHRFNDTTNASITVDYTEPGQPATTGEVLTPGLLTDGDPNNDGPDRAHHGHTSPFAQDEWSLIPDEHAHLSGVHSEGVFPAPAGGMPTVDVVFLDGSMPLPGTVLLLDRSGSMSVQTDGVPASQYVQEAGLYLYHSALSTDFVGTYLYNASVEELFEYEEYDPTNQLNQANFRSAQGLTDIAGALKTGIDALIAEHGQGEVNGAQIVLMSDGRQTTGLDLWSEVDRANMLGIKINTFSFGNADDATMQQIATDTSGDNIEVSEREDAFELKLGMAREFSDIRGYTPIHSFKDLLKKIEIVDRVQEFNGSFVVPPFSRNLSFYSFLEGGNAALYDLELTDPSGVVATGQADSIAERGRFNGIKTDKPEPGVWRYKLRGTRDTDFTLPQVAPFELTAYVRNPTLDAQLAFDGAGDAPGTIRLTGQVHYRYPLTNVRARVQIFRGGVRVGAVQLFDDGQTGGDLNAGDGVYTGILNVAEFGLDRPFAQERAAKTRLDGQFVVTKDSRPAPNAHYETGTTVEGLEDDFDANARFALPFEAWTTRMFDFTRKIDDRDGGSLHLLDPRKQFKIEPGTEGEFAVRLRGWQPNPDLLRISMGAGVKLTLADIQPLERTLGADLVLTYSVAKDAEEGLRHLVAQQGSSQAKIASVAFVVR